MIRVKSQETSLKFYQDIMGMTLQRVSENKEANFNLYFLGYGAPSSEKSANGVNPTASREGLLELTWNYGTEKEEGKVYHDGNSEPQGFGHICVSVDNLDEACKRFESKGVEWKKRLTDGRMKNVAFVLGECLTLLVVHGHYNANYGCRSRWLLDRGDPERKVRASTWCILDVISST